MGEICACVLEKSHHNNTSCPYFSMKSVSDVQDDLEYKGSHMTLTDELHGILLTFIIDNGCSFS